MRWFPFHSRLIRAFGVGAVALSTLPAVAQQPNPREADKSKSEVVEKGIKKAVADAAAPVVPPMQGGPIQPALVDPRRDVTKSLRIEPGAKQVVAQGANIPAVPAPPAEEANPSVAAGSVKWHKDFATACTASSKSGKPVFLFHLMGHLDKQFC